MPVKVAVIDDTRHVREMLASMLSLDGFDVVATGATAEESVLIASEQSPDVIVMDYAMPGTNGLEAARKIIKSRPGQKIVLYSAYLDDQIKSEAENIGVAVCVSKLEGIETLEKSIAELVRS